MFMEESSTLTGQFQRNTSRPIAGTCVQTAFTNPLNQAKSAETCLLQGWAVALTNDNLSTNANNGMGLAGNVLSATKATATVNGFVVDCPSTVSMDANDYPRLCKNQVGYVAMIGSGAKIYLAADASLQGKSVDTALKWDTANNCVSATTGVALDGVQMISQVVNGVAGRVSATIENVSESYETLVVKVRL